MQQHDNNNNNNHNTATATSNIITSNINSSTHTAKLIDCESVSRFEGVPALPRTVVVRPRFAPLDFDTKPISADTDNESLMYVLAWICNVEGFRDPTPNHDLDDALENLFVQRKRNVARKHSTLPALALYLQLKED